MSGPARSSRQRSTGRGQRAVSHPHDVDERQADRAADTVARGGSVSGWSFGSVAPTAGVHRQEKAPPSNEEKLKDAATKAGEAALETPAGKKLQEEVRELPVVKKATDFLGTTAGKAVAGGGVALGVGALAATKQPLPFQAPAIPLDVITPGLSAKVTVEGPLNAPTFAGLSLTYQEQGPKGKAGPTEKERIAADVARLRAQQEMFKPRAQKDQERAEERAAVARLLGGQVAAGKSTLVPLIGAAPKTVDVPAQEPAAVEKDQDKDEPPVQREPASPSAETTQSAAALDTSRVDDAVRGGGRPLEPTVRRSMESRFGHDFSAVRIHDHAAAQAASAGLQARAFTVGEDIAFSAGGYDSRTTEGRHLLAHELAHVVQQRGSGADAPARVHRRGFFESVGILLGLSEGTWSDKELRAYLDTLTTRGRVDGSYDADNVARAVVRLWKAGAAGWDLLGRQKALLVEEMLDGPTTGDDEAAILDLLERSDAGDLRAIFADPPARLKRLEGDLDGDNRDRLDAFVAARFVGGRTELRAGRVVVQSPTVPPGAPAYGFDAGSFEARLDSDRTWSELVAMIDRFSPADRATALNHLLHRVWPAAKSALGRARTEIFKDGVTDEQKKAIYEGTRRVRDRVAKTERILMHYFATAVPKTQEALLTGTRAADPGQAAALADVLRPHQYAAEAAAEDALIELDEEPVASTGPDAASPQTDAPAKPTRDEKKPTEKKPADLKGQPDKEDPPARASFHDPEKYRAEVAKALPGIIDAKYRSHVTDAGPRARMAEIEAMAVIAKRETDAVFGRFYRQSTHPEMKADRPRKPGNLHFWYDTADREQKALGPSGRRELAISWLRYYFQSDSTIRLINDTYNASPSFHAETGRPRNDEARILAALATDITKAQPPAKAAKGAATGADTGAPKEPSTVDKLIETWRSWGGMARGREVFVDLFHSADVQKDREACWDMFQTLVHEYIHTLVHPAYEKFANGFGTDGDQWNTLIEGVDSVLDEVVWAHVLPKTKDLAIRRVVEGEAHAKLPPIDPPYPGRYPSFEEAFRLVGLVGIDSVYAAYFLGEVDRITVPKGRSTTRKKATP